MKGRADSMTTLGSGELFVEYCEQASRNAIDRWKR